MLTCFSWQLCLTTHMNCMTSSFAFFLLGVIRRPKDNSVSVLMITLNLDIDTVTNEICCLHLVDVSRVAISISNKLDQDDTCQTLL